MLHTPSNSPSSSSGSCSTSGSLPLSPSLSLSSPEFDFSDPSPSLSLSSPELDPSDPSSGPAGSAEGGPTGTGEPGRVSGGEAGREGGTSGGAAMDLVIRPPIMASPRAFVALCVVTHSRHPSSCILFCVMLVKWAEGGRCHSGTVLMAFNSSTARDHMPPTESCAAHEGRQPARGCTSQRSSGSRSLLASPEKSPPKKKVLINREPFIMTAISAFFLGAFG